MTKNWQATFLSLITSLMVIDGIGHAADEPAKRAKQDVVADSVKQFSSEQGKHGWSYGYWEPADGNTPQAYDQERDFQLLTSFGDDVRNGLSQRKEFVTGKLWVLEDGRYYTSIWAEGGHPNSAMKLGKYEPTEQWAVRRWISSSSGPATISGHVGKVMPWGKNWTGHCLARIVVDGKTVYTETMDETGHEYSVDIDLKVGSKIDFLIGPGPNIGVTKFTAKIKSK